MKNESKTIKMKLAKKKIKLRGRNEVQHNEVEEKDRVRNPEGIFVRKKGRPVVALWS